MVATRPIGLPHFHLLADRTAASNAFEQGVRRLQLQNLMSYTVHNASLSQLNASLKFDLVVSPANSYGILDGGFDDAISRAWSPADDYLALTRAVQVQLYDHCLGYLPPGECFIARIPAEFANRSRYSSRGWGCKYIAICPTMRKPQNVEWDRDVVYECMWSLLCAIDRHNRAAADRDKIKSILMTPLATATGGFSMDRWASQCLLAIKHFADALQNPGHWSRIGWVETTPLDMEITQTYGL